MYSVVRMVNEMTVSEYNFSGVVGTNENGTELRGSMILTYSKLLFISGQKNQEINIPLESITFVKGKKGAYTPSLDVQWDDGVITHRMMFLQDAKHLARCENISFIPNLIKEFRYFAAAGSRLLNAS